MMRTSDRTAAGDKACFNMVFHCHQPVFNLEQVIEKAYYRAYLPLFRALSGHESVKATVHLSGGLLEWIEKRHPDLLDLMRDLVARGQVELLGGGCYEPVMTLLTETDRARQIDANSKILRRLFGTKPRGIWISERVWHRSLVDTIADRGIEYAIVDDHHILNSGVSEQEVSRPFRITGRKGALTLLPALRKLRYLMPFRSPEFVAGHLKERAEKATDGHKCFIFADDGEKFGAWPRTYSRVRKRGWLDPFFELLESGSIGLETALCSDIVDTKEAVELADVPASSYPELMGWSNGNFLNFMDKYPEAGRMRERMLAVSERVRECERTGKASGKAVRELMKAQTGCAYWHGTFGGVYLPHMREGVYRHLIEAENILDRDVTGSGNRVEAVEVDKAGGDRRTRLRNRHVDIFTSASAGGVIYEMDDRIRRLNLLNSMTRVREKYHNKLEKGYRRKITEAREAALRGEYPDIHDILGLAEKGLSGKLYYDDRKRDSFATHIAAPDTPLDHLVSGGGAVMFRSG
ncbi:MAG: DUF1925 domain-containing protein, partial [Candidatus Omnitrophica bacterium]|nr:DUF1925 domain-containing protein [Candidatus Omnitrophota bacterium]